MILRVDAGSAVPPYEQVRRQIATMSATGVLPAGTRLPTIRQLSKDLGLAGGTIARAYRELEAEGVIATHGRHGSFVAEANSAGRRERGDADLAAVAQDFAIRVHQLGVEPRRAIEMAEEAFRAVQISQPARKA
ncbi:MAG TPA: GntR family transcriptional regulator [Nocardioidaceae bacterium]